MLYYFAKYLFLLFFTVFCRWRVTGREKFPRRGPVVVVANHISLWDPIAVGVAMPRRVYFMAKEELFRIAGLGWIIRGLGAFPVRRGQADLAAMRWGMRLLRQDKVLGIFPEGGRNRTEETVMAFQRGAALLAVRGRAALVPVAVIGTDRIAGRRGIFHRFEVRIGDPIFLAPEAMLADKSELARVSLMAQQAVADLTRQL